MERAPPAYMGRPRRKPPSPGRQWFVARRFPTLAARSFQPPLHGPVVRASRPQHQTGLRLALRITLAHFSVSSAMSVANAAGVIGMGAPPRSANRAFILGSASPALTSL